MPALDRHTSTSTCFIRQVAGDSLTQKGVQELHHRYQVSIFNPSLHSDTNRHQQKLISIKVENDSCSNK